MRSRMIHADRGKCFALLFSEGEEVIEGLREFALRHRLRTARFVAQGALSGVTLHCYDLRAQDYSPLPLSEPVEIRSFVGDISPGPEGGQHAVQAHLVVSRADGSVCGGRAVRGHVRATLEVLLSECAAA